MERTPEFAFSLPTAMLTLSGGGGRGEPPSLTVSMATLPEPSKEAGGAPSRCLLAVGKDGGEHRLLFPVVSGGEISEGPFPVWTQTETH